MAIAPGMDRSKAPMLRLMSEERRNRELFEKIIRANSGTVNAGGPIFWSKSRHAGKYSRR